MSNEIPKSVELLTPVVQAEWKDLLESGVPGMVASAQLANAVLGLLESGISEKLQGEEFVAKSKLLAGIDGHFGGDLLRFLVIRGVLETTDDAYRFTRKGRLLFAEGTIAMLGFYFRAYGPVVNRIGDLLTKKARYGKDVERGGGDTGRYSAMFTRHFNNQVALTALQDMGSKCILDLGCGGGQFLVDAALEKPGLRGVGLDLSEDGIQHARKLAKDKGVSDRVEFVVGDAFRPDTWPEACSKADAWVAVGMLHEHFREGEGAVIELLDRYAKRMKGRVTGFVLGEPELHYDEKDADFFLIHTFTLQGYPRAKAGWLDLFPRTQLRCERTYQEKNVMRFWYFDLRPK